jgi:Ser/Thr protein kinase RdoA (MazF antagonist)
MRQGFLSQINREQLPAEAARLWAVQNCAPVHVQDSENFVYRLEYGQPPRSYFLRLTHAKHRSFEQIAAELDFILYLAGRRYLASRPVRSRSGNLIETLETENALFHACVFEAAPGAHVEVASSDWGPHLFKEWGRSLATLHTLSRVYAPVGHRRLSWDEDDVLVNARDYLPPAESSARRELGRVRDWLSGQPAGGNEFGLIHGDFCRVNFHYERPYITVFDFDDSCYHWFVYDLVCALAPASFRPAEERRAYRDWMIEGYGQVLQLDEAWKLNFDWLLRLRHLYIFTLHLRNWDGEFQQHPKRPLLERLRQTFDQPMEW